LREFLPLKGQDFAAAGDKSGGLKASKQALGAG
jgi:hypothetical protein